MGPQSPVTTIGRAAALQCTTALHCTALHCAALHHTGTRALGRSLATGRSAGQSPGGIRSNFPPGGSRCSTTNPLHCTALRYPALHCTALRCADGTAAIHLNHRITRHICKEKSIQNISQATRPSSQLPEFSVRVIIKYFE